MILRIYASLKLDNAFPLRKHEVLIKINRKFTRRNISKARENNEVKNNQGYNKRINHHLT